MAQGKSNWTKNARQQFPKKEKVVGTATERKRKKEKREKEVLSDILADVFEENISQEIADDKAEKCEMCGKNAVHINLMFGEIIQLCGICQKKYGEGIIGKALFTEKKIRIVKLSIGGWVYNIFGRNTNYIYDDTSLQKEDFCYASTMEEAEFILRKFGEKKQLAIVNNRRNIIQTS